jgi:hypothetical protein
LKKSRNPLPSACLKDPVFIACQAPFQELGIGRTMARTPDPDFWSSTTTLPLVFSLCVAVENKISERSV